MKEGLMKGGLFILHCNNLLFFIDDLGRMVGSYEKYCLRTLNERYRNEPLLLSKIHCNFR